MDRCRVLALTLVLTGCLALSGAPAVAAPPADRAQALFDRFLGQLERVEQKYPMDQHAFFQLRQTVQALFEETRAAPAGLTPTQSRVPSTLDPLQGIDLYVSCRNLRGQELRQELHRIIAIQFPVGYQQAQDIIFGKLDNHDGEVECVYTGRRIHTNGEPHADDMNVEHTWPQSQGATGDAKCDLHHLFPTDSHANNLRGSFPFGPVSHVTWQEGGSRFDGDTFEVRPQQRGNTARAKFYFAVRYGKQIPADEEAALREWSREDPPDTAERARNDRIENFQHNRNPFVDHPEYVDQITDF